MKYVLDSSVALKWVLPEADSAKAIRLRDDYKNGIHELLAPDIFTPEIANGLASAERQGRIKTGESAVFLLDIIRSPRDSSDATAPSSGYGTGNRDSSGRLRLHLPCPRGIRKLRVGDCR